MDFINELGWKFWLCFILVIFVILWITIGGKDLQQLYRIEDEPPIYQREGYSTPVPSPSPYVEGQVEGVPDQEPEPGECPIQRKFRSIGEELTCSVMEEILRRRVETGIRPPHLRNPETGRCLEYDCYDPVLKIAIEYNGRQHYEYTPRFHRDKKAFYDQVYRDQLKLRRSEESGIVLIRVPYTIDVCDPNNNEVSGWKYNSRIKRDERRVRLKKYLQPILLSISPP